MKLEIKIGAALLASILTKNNAFGQWTAIENQKLSPITVWCSDKEVKTLKKESDTSRYYDWRQNLIIECPKIASIDETKLEEAYENTNVGELLYFSHEPAASIENKNLSVLFKNFDNLIKLSAHWSSDIVAYRLEATDATLNKISSENETAYLINPKGSMSTVKLIAKDKQGNESILRNWNYRVIPMPEPKLANEVISKKEGVNLEFKFDDFSKNAQYVIESIEIPALKKIIKDDFVIPAYQIKKLKEKSFIQLLVKVVELTSGEKYTISHGLVVTE